MCLSHRYKLALSPWIIYTGTFFWRVTNFAKMGKIFYIYNICVNHFLQSKKFLKENDNGYNLSVIDYLQFKRDQGKSED